MLLGCFLIGQIFFYLGGLRANKKVSGKLGMKLAIVFAILAAKVQQLMRKQFFMNGWKRVKKP